MRWSHNAQFLIIIGIAHHFGMSYESLVVPLHSTFVILAFTLYLKGILVPWGELYRPAVQKIPCTSHLPSFAAQGASP